MFPPLQLQLCARLCVLNSLMDEELIDEPGQSSDLLMHRSITLPCVELLYSLCSLLEKPTSHTINHRWSLCEGIIFYPPVHGYVFHMCDRLATKLKFVKCEPSVSVELN